MRLLVGTGARRRGRRRTQSKEIPAKQFVAWLGIANGKFYDWRTPSSSCADKPNEVAAFGDLTRD